MSHPVLLCVFQSSLAPCGAGASRCRRRPPPTCGAASPPPTRAAAARARCGHGLRGPGLRDPGLRGPGLRDPGLSCGACCRRRCRRRPLRRVCTFSDVPPLLVVSVINVASCNMRENDKERIYWNIQWRNKLNVNFIVKILHKSRSRSITLSRARVV